MAGASGRVQGAADGHHADDAAPLTFAEDFPRVTREDWLALVGATLRQAGRSDSGDPLAALSTHTIDGLRIAPLYARADASPSPSSVPDSSGWDVRQRHADPDPSRTNAAIRADLDNGATSIWLVVGSGGLPIGELPRALDSVDLDGTPIALDAGADAITAAKALCQLADRDGMRLSGTLGADPIAVAARTGERVDLGELPALARLAEHQPGLRAITVDGTVYSDAGASDVDELAITAAVAVSYLRTLTDAGWPMDASCGQFEFRLSVSDDQFVSIAKLRAARRIWARIVELCGGGEASAAQRQHAVTSTAMLTRRDPWTNLMRGTVACFAAAAAGADVITVAPFDAAVGVPNDLGRRLARNTSAILHDESHLARVSDPAAGSGCVEALTEQVAQAAWARFTGLEAAGGAANLSAIRALTATSFDRRRTAIAQLRLPITGVTAFAFLDEQKITRDPAPSRPDSALPAHRYAEEFEVLRDRADASATPPRVFLGVLGNMSTSADQVTFASNLFAAGGVRTVVAEGDDADQLVARFADAETSVACLCGEATTTETVATALRTAGANRVWRIHPGSDALAVLSTTLADLGVA
jgi:methylmalonyl-CoA mutase